MTRTKRCLLVLLDGLADRAQEELSGQTPLMAARTPNLDALAALGSAGHFHALYPGAALPSETAHFLLMGYGPEHFPGRGYLEALGEGVPLKPGQVLILARLATCRREGGSLLILDRFPSLGAKETDALWEAVADFGGSDGRARLHPTRKGRGILELSGDLAGEVTDTDPMADGHPVLQPLPWREKWTDPRAGRTAGLLAEYLHWAHARLARHPANQAREKKRKPPVNAIITHRSGWARPAPPLSRMWGIEALSISSDNLYKGVFLAMGAEAVVVPQEPDPQEEMRGKLALALKELERKDFVHLHTKVPDEAGHRRDPLGKRDALEALDAGLAGLVEEVRRRRDLVVVVTGDHATPCSGSLIHSGETSPLIMAGPGVWRDRVERFDEASCAGGALGLLRGRELMATIINLLDRAKLWGLMDNPDDLPWFPGPRTPMAGW